MNWEAIGALAEGIGALAVVITLVYLAVQVRYAKAASADTNRLIRASGVREMTLALLTNDDARNSVLRALGAPSFYKEYAMNLDITQIDAERMDYLAQYYFWLHWGQYSATITEKDLDELRNIVVVFYTSPAMRYAWEHSPFGKQIFENDFIVFVDSVLLQYDQKNA